MVSRENIAASIQEMRGLTADIESVEVSITKQKSEIGEARVSLREDEKKIRRLKEGHHQKLAQFQDGLFQDMAYPANYLAGEPALEYVDDVLVSAGKNFADESMPAANTLSKIALPNEEKQPVFFDGKLNGEREPLITLFQGNDVASSSLTVENHTPGILTFMTQIHDPSVLFARRASSYEEWRAGYPRLKDGHIRIDMLASALTITDDPERTVWAIKKEDQAVGKSIIAIGAEAVSAAIEHSRADKRSYADSPAELSDNLMKRVLAKILQQPIRGRSLEVDGLRDAYYPRVTQAVGSTYDLRDEKDLPLLLHGDIFEDIFSEAFDQERFQRAVAQGLDNSMPTNFGGHAGLANLVEDRFWATHDVTGDINNTCGNMGGAIMRSLATNNIIKGSGHGSLTLNNVLDFDSVGAPIKLEVAEEALRQHIGAGWWGSIGRDIFSLRTWKLRRYMNVLDKQVDTV